MKRIFLALVLLASIFAYGQSLTSTIGQVEGSMNYYFNLPAMADSTGSYYSPEITISKYGNIPFSTYPMTGIVKTSSTAGACSTYVIIQGRWRSGSTYSDWIDLDTCNASGTETAQGWSEDLGGYTPDQMRIHVDGLSGNRADAVVKVFWTLIPRGNYLLKIN